MRRLARGLKSLFTRWPKTPLPASPVHRVQEQLPNTPLSSDLDTNLQAIHATLGHETPDVITRRVQLAGGRGPAGAICYLSHLVNSETVKDDILAPLMRIRDGIEDTGRTRPRQYLETLVERYVPMGRFQIVETQNEVVDRILDGNTVLFLDNCRHAAIFDTSDVPTRGIEEPSGETVLRGPRDGFNESLKDCLSLIRRRIKSQSLRIEKFQVGRRSMTDIALVYFNDVTNKDLIEEAKRRISVLDIDSITSASVLAQFMEEAPHSPFPTYGLTERPDFVQKLLSDGRFAIIVDGSPQVLIAPHVFTDNFLTAEDLVTRIPYATMIKIFRILGAFIALSLPSLYIAATTHHPEVLPTSLAMAVAAAREGVPFPAFIEAIIMEVVLEIIREGSGRLPGPLGQTIGIVGALILGDAAITAGLVSPLLVIVVALTTLANFIIPNTAAAQGARVLRFPLMIAAATLGLPGITFCIIALSIHLVGLHSFGVPYLTPWAPFRSGSSSLRTVIKLPVWAYFRRAAWVHPHDRTQQDELYLRDWNTPTRRRQNKDRKTR